MASLYGHLNFFILLIVIAPANYLVQGQGTSVGFYARTCPKAESIIRSTVAAHFSSDATVAPALLRLHFHDCFVRGCDASVLISGAGTEKTALINSGLRGYEVIDDAKTQLEAACPGTVSCADILALAARDSVALTKGISWLVPTGRKDGRVSLSAETSDLPSFTDSMDDQKKKFAAKNLTPQDLVALVGAHTIGTSACQFFSYRLYNFTTTGADASLAASFVSQLQALCPQAGSGTTRVALDTGSSDKFDTSYYANLRDGQGVLESDSKLWTDASTKPFVQRFLGVRGLSALTFNIEFAKSMVRMSNVGVKSGSDGEIRKICSAIN